MKTIDEIYINGQFVKPHGNEVIDLLNPTNNQLIGKVLLGNEADVRIAIKSAKAAFKEFSQSSKEERINYLQKLHDAILERVEDLKEATVEEYGAPTQRAIWSNRIAAESFLHFKKVLVDYDFEKQAGNSKVIMEPLGVVAIFTAWNSNSGSICVKLAAAIAAGCTAVIKPSEFSAIQTQILAECFHKAGLPPGIINIVNGRGDVIGPELSRDTDIAKIAFTGSTVVGKMIARDAIDTMKRVTLELSGKSPNIILDDANLDAAVPLAINAAFQNNGQACIAGSRLIVPEHLLDEICKRVKDVVDNTKVGDPRNETTIIGPLASVKQYERVQAYIKSGTAAGAKLIVGGEGKPKGLEAGNFVKPTVFANVSPDMQISREEIFGPVLSILSYKTEEEAIELANDTIYGLLAYVSSSNVERAKRIASKIEAGRVLINVLSHDPLAPFGGFKQSGVGREGGVFGLEEYLEPKAIII
jgi:aldehyde dehydrogenase (NAD+)